VIWLNELQLFALPADMRAGEDAAAALLELLDRDDTGPVVVLGTIWRDPYWSQLKADYTGPAQDPHAYARLLARRVVAIDMPERTGTDRVAIEAAARIDPRWRAALREAPDEPVQFLAGAAHLRQRYLDATCTRRAVLRAAGDARRVGAPQHLPLAFLIDAARDYLPAADRDGLPPEQRDAGVWVRMALDGDRPHDNAALSRGSRGVRAPLHDVASDTGQDDGSLLYELADFLEQHLRRERATIKPFDSLWVAAREHLHDPATLLAMARAAESRGRLRPAAALYERAAGAGNTDAWTQLAWLYEQAGDRAGAEDAYRHAGSAGNTDAWTRLALLREQAGDRAGAEDAYRHAGSAGNTDAWTRLALLREQAGDRAGAEDAVRRPAAAGNTSAWTWLARLREQMGDRAAAEDAAQQAAAAGDFDAWTELALLREEAGDRAEAEDAYRQAAAAGMTGDWTIGLVRRRRLIHRWR